MEVYFDDFKVTHSKSPVIQTSDYYPFGLAYNQYQRENSLINKFKFQSQEHIDDLGLNWDSFKWRNHQPDIGRFFNIDPLAAKYVHNSPYAFSENKVTSHVELEGMEAENFMSKFKKPSELALKPVPSGAGVQNQSYSVVVTNPKKDVSDLRSTFKDKPQSILSNSKAEFQPVDGDGNKLEHANMHEGSYMEIAIPGPLNNSTVKETGETSDANGFSMTFGTLEGHVEAGQITFSATQNKDGSVTFGINSTSKVDSGYTKLFAEGTAREKQAQSWNEVLTNAVKYLQGTEASRTSKTEDQKKKTN